ncbi:MAG: COQ9 family protein [Micavibrio sp.]|nr:COQ9 family protein [Micavibrio sp.]
MTDKDDILSIQDEIVLAFAEDVPFDGWGWASVCSAAERVGHSRGMARAVFPREMRDVRKHFSGLADRKMIEALKDINKDDMPVRERVRIALLMRFEFLSPYKDAVRQSMQSFLLPTRKPAGAKMVWGTADVIWDWVGDNATDYNRYTKRGLLSGIIISSTFYWLNEEGADLDEFIGRRIENVMTIGKFLGRFKKAA